MASQHLLVGQDDKRWRRSCEVGAMLRGAIALVLLSPFILALMALTTVLTLLVVAPLSVFKHCCLSRRSTRCRALRKIQLCKAFRSTMMVLHLLPWGETLDGLWMPWWRACCRRRLATYVRHDGQVVAIGPRDPMPEKPEGCVRVVAVSDTHGKFAHTDIAPGDILVHCGDVLARNGRTGCRSPRRLLQSFNEQLAALPHPHKVVIGGNHDGIMEALGVEGMRKVLTNAVYLENTGVKLAGLSIWGCPYSPRSASKNSAFQCWSREDIQRHCNAVPAGTDVVLSHGVSDALDARVAAVGARFHAFGHFHQQFGLHSGRGPCVRFNAAVCDAYYRALHGCVVIDIRPR